MLDALVERWTSERDPADVMRTLQDAGVAAGVVQDVADLAADPQLAARGFFETLRHLTRGTVVATGVPLGLTETPARTGLAGQAIGQDHAYVFGEVLGMAEEEIARAVATAPSKARRRNAEAQRYGRIPFRISAPPQVGGAAAAAA